MQPRERVRELLDAFLAGCERAGIGTLREYDLTPETYRADWERLLVGQPIIWSPVRSLLEATRDPQVTEMGVLADVAHPEAEGLRTVAPQIELSAHPMPGTRPAPVLGADGEAVLRAAGCSSEEISAALATER